jgi:trk system potassium uptake protein TrkA
MKPPKKQICIIGLGHFGASLARALAGYAEVVAIDAELERVNDISEYVDQALCLDGSDPDALANAVSDDFDEAIVSIGEQMEASILCTLHLKQIGVPSIRVKAQNEDHAEILRRVGATKVIFPERESAERLALNILNPNMLDFVPLAKEYSITDVAAPKPFFGASLSELKIRTRFGIFIIAMKRDGGKGFVFLPGPDEIIRPGDVLVVIGKERDILNLPDEGGASSQAEETEEESRKEPGEAAREKEKSK